MGKEKKIKRNNVEKEEAIELEGEIIEVLPNTYFRVKLSNGASILATISGRLRKNYIRILLGDKVRVEISPYDITRGRITWRDKGGKAQLPQNEGIGGEKIESQTIS